MSITAYVFLCYPKEWGTGSGRHIETERNYPSSGTDQLMHDVQLYPNIKEFWCNGWRDFGPAMPNTTLCPTKSKCNDVDLEKLISILILLSIW